MRWLVLLAIAACVKPASHLCDNGLTCPDYLECDELNKGCVELEQITACNDLPDRDPCDTEATGAGTCHNGVCLEASCGNGRLDLVEAEVCDDGNQSDGDECAADCSSTLVCGNGIVDLSEGEACDDTNFVGNDGCGSTCKSERVRWSDQGALKNSDALFAAYDAGRGVVVLFDATAQRTSEWRDGAWLTIASDQQPPARIQSMMTYDHSRREVILYGGGVAGTNSITDTWAWNGSNWRQVSASGPNLSGAAIAYDAKRKRVVMFGGYSDTSSFTNHTWELIYSPDGTATWTDVSPTVSPASRVGAMMAFDPVRGVVVLFGGSEASSRFNDVWEYDGMTWTERTPGSGSPAGVYNGAFAWDARLQKMVLFGGINQAGTETNAMATWNGATWTNYTATRPSARYGHVLVEANGALLLFGGSDTSGLAPATTHLFDGTSWSTASAGPTPRFETAFASAPTQRRFVEFGGTNGSTAFRDTWELGPRGWRVANPGTAIAPPGLVGARMVFDVAANDFVLFGGADTSAAQSTDLWTLDANDVWSQHTPASPPPGRSYPVMVYDAKRGETVLFGGGIITGSFYTPQNDTWTLKDLTWTKQQPATVPSARIAAAGGYDPIREQVVMFGGGGITADTWIWDGTNWTKIDTPVHPPDRLHGTLVWHPARKSLVLTGGSFNLMDAWEWVGVAASPPAGEWRQIAAGIAPPPRASFATGATLDGTGVRIEGGSDSALGGGSPSGGPWILRWSGDHPIESCRAGEDLDGDTLVGCEDPDCWSVCTPACPPGTTCTTPSTCGNGVCDPTDTCALCAADCPTTCVGRCGDFVCATGEVCPGDCAP